MDKRLSRSASLIGYRQLVSDLGGNIESYMRQAAIRPEWLELDDHLIPSQQLVDLLEITAATLPCETFGLQLSRYQNLGMLGPVGLLIQQSETLLEAFVQLRRFLHVHSQAGLVQYQQHGKTLMIQFEPLLLYRGHARQLIDLSLAVGYGIVNELVGKRIPLKSVHFAYRRPDNISLYQKLFDCPVYFDSEVSGVVIEQQYLSKPLRQNQHQTRQFISQYLQNIEHDVNQGLIARVRQLMRQLLPFGQCSIEQVATLLQVNPRTLQRRLQEKNTSYQQLLDSERFAMAQRYLTESDVSLSHLAELLGFGNLSVFSKRFKQWSGESPTQYMKSRELRIKLRS